MDRRVTLTGLSFGAGGLLLVGIDSVESGPPAGVAVGLVAGMDSDRFSVTSPRLACLTNPVAERRATR